MYVSTGNGTFDTDLDADGFPSRGDYGNASLKLAVDTMTTPAHPGRNGWGLKVVDYFVPQNFDALNGGDADVGGGGVVVLPDAAGSAAHRHLLIGGGKDHRIFLLDRDKMGRFHPDGDQAWQEVRDAVGRIFTAPSFFDGRLSLAADGDHLKTFPLHDARLADQPAVQSESNFGFPGATGTISCQAGRNAILWLLDRGSNTLRAFDGPNFSQSLYSTAQGDGAADAPGVLLRFTVPSVVNGRVYIGTNNSLAAYGLRRSNPGASAPTVPTLTAPVTPTNATATFREGRIDLAWQDHADDTAHYRILRKIGTGGVFQPIADLPAHSVRFTDRDNIQLGTYYHYHILALNAAGNSDFAGVALNTPARK